MPARSDAKAGRTPTVRNRRARYNYEILETFECGIVLANFQDLHEGDVLETYETRLQERELSS